MQKFMRAIALCRYYPEVITVNLNSNCASRIHTSKMYQLKYSCDCITLPESIFQTIGVDRNEQVLSEQMDRTDNDKEASITVPRIQLIILKRESLVQWEGKEKETQNLASKRSAQKSRGCRRKGLYSQSSKGKGKNRFNQILVSAAKKVKHRDGSQWWLPCLNLFNLHPILALEIQKH